MEHQFSSIDKQVWDNVAHLEDSQCVRRFLCEVAADGFEAPEYIGLVKNIAENEEVSSTGNRRRDDSGLKSLPRMEGALKASSLLYYAWL